MPTLKYYKCHRPTCQKKDQGRFWQAASPSDPPKCPQCGLTTADPKFGEKIQRLVITHFDPPTEFPGLGWNHRACDKEKSICAEEGPNGVPNPWHAGTGIVGVVTCPACKETPEYKAALGVVEDDDDTPKRKQLEGSVQRLETVAPLRIT